MNLEAFLKDKLILGSLAGVISDIIMNLFEEVLQKVGLIKFTLDQFAGSALIRDKTELMLFSSSFVGFLAGVALCMILGIIFVYLVYFTGFRWVVFKGLIYGFILWFLIYGGIKSGLHISYLQDYDPFHTITAIFTHLIFGLSLGTIVLKVETFKSKG